MKKIIGYILLGIAILIIGRLVIDRGNLKSSISYYIGKLDEQKKISDEKIKASEKVIQEKDELIAQLNGNIDSSNTQVENLVVNIANSGDKIRDLEKRLQGLKDKDEIIRNQSLQIEEWKVRFSLVQREVDEKDKIIFSLNEKYKASVVIREELTGQIKAWADKYSALNDLAKVYQIKLLKANARSTLKSGIVIAAAAYIVYTAVKK